jgi:Domain of unknown function (DUF1992)
MRGPYESWVDRQIREAQQRGDFDDLPGAGRPLRSLGAAYDQGWWVKELIEREHLDMAALLPPQLALRREAQGLRARLAHERTEQAVRDLVEDFNERVRECWRRPLEGPPVVVRTMNVEEVLAWWRAQAAEGASAVSPTVQTPERAAAAGRHGALGRLLRRLQRQRRRPGQSGD